MFHSLSTDCISLLRDLIQECLNKFSLQQHLLAGSTYCEVWSPASHIQYGAEPNRGFNCCCPSEPYCPLTDHMSSTLDLLHLYGALPSPCKRYSYKSAMQENAERAYPVIGSTTLLGALHGSYTWLRCATVCDWNVQYLRKFLQKLYFTSRFSFYYVVH